MSKKSILVLGPRRLGGAVAERYAGAGWNVATMSRSEGSARAVRERIPGALGLTGDAADASSLAAVVEEAADRFGGLDVAINCVSPVKDGVVTGGALVDLQADAMRPYLETLIPATFNFHRICGSHLSSRGRGTLIQVTGGSARRAMPERGPWASAAYAVRALTQSSAQELRGQGVHVALLVVDAVISSDKTRDQLEGKADNYSTRHEDVVDAVDFLVRQSPRAWTHELTLTPQGDRWVP